MEGRIASSAAHDGNLSPQHSAPRSQALRSLPTHASGALPAGGTPTLSSLHGEPRYQHSHQSTVRVVTPEPAGNVQDGSETSLSPLPSSASFFDPTSPQSPPRSTLSSGSGSATVSLLATGASFSSNRRQGLVFNDPFGKADSPGVVSPGLSYRPRTPTTTDGAPRQQPATQAETRGRLGSSASSGTLPSSGGQASMDSQRFPTAVPLRLPDAREKKSASRTRLVKRAFSRTLAPAVALPPSANSLPLPVATGDANKLLYLMITLAGRMKGEVEYQGERTGPWYRGTCYIDEDKGSLMFDSGETTSFHITLVTDLRGCRILPIDLADNGIRCLQILSTQLGLDLYLRSLPEGDLELWLASLLCWQQLRPIGVKPYAGWTATSPGVGLADAKRRVSLAGPKEATIIKVGKVMLWHSEPATSPRDVVRRPQNRDLHSLRTTWTRVSCILQDNGEFKLMTENDVTVLSIIELSQLSRFAIQKLDRSVLDEEYCIGIFPAYCSTSKKLSVFRPIYLALDSRVLFEVWFVLLRAFTVPELYAVDPADSDQVGELTDLAAGAEDGAFRVEKRLAIRVTEAKIRVNTLPTPQEGVQPERRLRMDQDRNAANYLVEIILDDEVRARTSIRAHTSNPFWREDFEFGDLPPRLPPLSLVLKKIDGDMESVLHPQVFSGSYQKSGDLVEQMCGSVDLHLHQLEQGKDYERWFPIHDEKQQSIGTLYAKVTHEELVVPPLKDYQALSELLHTFTTALTAQIAECLPGHLRRLAEILLNIFQASGFATEWLMSLAEDEIDGIGNQAALRKPRFSKRLRSTESVDSASEREALVRDMGKSLAGEANLLFRGNSLLTQALEFNMRRLGKEYLEEVLATKLAEINDANLSCEVDPSKLQPGEDLQQHWARLIRLTTEIWECIYASVDRVPPELRHILKYIRAVAEDRYGDFLRTVTYTSVSGFLFLRFVCPAILSPKLFGLLPDHPCPRAQRTFTLVAKALQALANLGTIGKKETWMEPMNRFLTAQKQFLKDFLDRICAIPMERSGSLIPASYSTPVTISGRLSPMAREGFPSLPFLIDSARNFAALVKLWGDVQPIAAPDSHLYDTHLLEFNYLCAALQQRADNFQARLESFQFSDNASQLHLSESDRLSILDAVKNHARSPSVADLRQPDSPGSMAEGLAVVKHGGSQESSSIRNVSGLSFTEPGVGTTGRLAAPNRNGKHARRFLGGFIRIGRTGSPDEAGLQSPGVDYDAEKNQSDGATEPHTEQPRGLAESWHAGVHGSDNLPIRR